MTVTIYAQYVFQGAYRLEHRSQIDVHGRKSIGRPCTEIQKPLLCGSARAFTRAWSVRGAPVHHISSQRSPKNCADRRETPLRLGRSSLVVSFLRALRHVELDHFHLPRISSCRPTQQNKTYDCYQSCSTASLPGTPLPSSLESRMALPNPTETRAGDVPPTIRAVFHFQRRGVTLKGHGQPRTPVPQEGL